MDKKSGEFKNQAHQIIDWIANYFERLEDLPVKSQVQPGEIYDQLPEKPPEMSESLEQIMEDLNKIILPGITHWQSPKFFAYFPANSSLPSLFAEMLTAAMGVQGMKWETSPAAAELEEKVMNWLKSEIQLPEHFHGVIQDSASTATLVSLLTAREKYSDYSINEQGFYNQPTFRIYCSSETHSSIERAVKVAGFGKENLVKVPVDSENKIDTIELEGAIHKDLQTGYKPLAVIATLGTTGTTAVDPLMAIADIKNRYDLWLHVDAAYAGTALLLEEYQWMIYGIEQVDTFVFNPHKWLFTNFDCSAYYVKDKEALTNTFQIVPEYLKTQADGQVNNYSDWTIPLGRRFRALKLWFVLRYYGMNQIREKLRYHLELASEFKQWVEEATDFELLAPVTMNVVSFRYHPSNINDEEKLNALNEKLLQRINKTGKMYFTHTKVNGKYTLRMVIGQTDVERRHIEEAWDVINEELTKL
ncbi:MAG: pyridoxal phosphate-dependent decarboxylase family protein [Bacteroidota bacterium]